MSIPSNMVREQHPVRSPLQPSQANAQPQSRNMEKSDSETQKSPIRTHISVEETASPQPMFGRPTALGGSTQSQPFGNTQPGQRPANVLIQRQAQAASQRDPYSRLFVHRPQLHKPSGDSNPLSQLNKPVKSSSVPIVRDTSTSVHSQSGTGNIQASKPILHRDFDDEDIFKIPKAPTWRPHVPVHRTFSSNQDLNPFVRPKAEFIDLAARDRGSAANADPWMDRYDPHDFIDAAKANEQLKALFEGGIEDEADKPRKRTKKKKEIATESEVDGLVDQVKGLNVGPGQEDKSEQTVDKKEETEKKGEEEEEDDAEYDDGTREGLKVKLLPHQISGVKWMQSKEVGRADGKGKTGGGILADDMGLGKTIQSIALILANSKANVARSNSDETTSPSKFDKSTLVVAPLALIKQWESEIKDRTEENHKLSVCVHHGPKRTKSFKELSKYDVVITTYSTLTSEHDASSDKFGVGCFGVKWHRIILDEAHSIKNRNAKSTKAACALNAQFRWCLTGTPMQNNLDELQSLIHFVRIAPLDKLEYWRDQITRPMSAGRGGLAIKRLQAVLGNIMKRRTKDVLKQDGGLGGNKSNGNEKSSTDFRLVKRTVEAVEAVFTDQELSLYKRLESRTDKRLEMMMAGHKMSYASALVLLMRLRQACNHPRLIGSELTLDNDNMTGNGSQTPRKKTGHIVDDTDDLTAMLGGLSVESKLCDICQIELDKNKVRNGTLRCDECENDLQEQEALGKDKNVRRKDQKAIVKSDRKINRRVIVDSDDEDGDEVDDQNDGSNATKTKTVDLSSSTTVDEDKSEDEDDDDDETSDSDEEEDSTYDSDNDNMGDLVSSTKIRHLLSILRTDAHKHKYIVFSVFTSMLDLIEPFLEQSHIKFVRYDGSMRNDMREASLNKLRNDPTVRVLLCSLRSGSLGLNLTAASRVVILEPFWNPFVEEQAIDRVHRLNQTQDVIVYKLTIKDTVESRILQLQEKKRALAKATIEGTNASGIAKLSMAEMLKLFDHKAERDARVDMVGMPDSGALLVDGESTEERQYKSDHQNGSQQDRDRNQGQNQNIKQNQIQHGQPQYQPRPKNDRERNQRESTDQKKKVNDIYSRRW